MALCMCVHACGTGGCSMKFYVSQPPHFNFPYDLQATEVTQEKKPNTILHPLCSLDSVDHLCECLWLERCTGVGTVTTFNTT